MPPRALTKREHEVARLVSQGLTNIQIGKRLNTSRFTVMRQVSNICDKLGINAPEGEVERWGYSRIRLAIIVNVDDLTQENLELRERLKRYEASE